VTGIRIGLARLERALSEVNGLRAAAAGTGRSGKAGREGAGGPPRLEGLLDRLDRFEGPGYRRILVPFFTGDRDVAAVGNLYELNADG
jgi:hypothetical protein